MMKMGAKEKTRILLVDDDAPFRKLLRTLLTKVSGVEVVGEAGDGKIGIELMHILLPNIVIMNVSMPVMDGVEATQWITTVFPGVKVIAFSSSADNHTVKSMFEAGASDFLDKSCGFGGITSAIKKYD
jgi:NarL family two-component system response regulator LiaR